MTHFGASAPLAARMLMAGRSILGARMKVYSKGAANLRVYAQPGREFPHVSDWMVDTGVKDSAGKAIMDPILFTISFRNGVAEVPSNLGRYLIDSKLARRSPIILPAGVEA